MLALNIRKKNKKSQRDDNNQNDDVISWLNAPLGREEKEKEKLEGERGTKTFCARYLDGINSNVITEWWLLWWCRLNSQVCKSHWFWFYKCRAKRVTFYSSQRKVFRLCREVLGRRGIIQALGELTVIYRNFDIIMELFKKIWLICVLDGLKKLWIAKTWNFNGFMMWVF